jgi:hypothetical protein
MRECGGLRPRPIHPTSYAIPPLRPYGASDSRFVYPAIDLPRRQPHGFCRQQCECFSRSQPVLAFMVYMPTLNDLGTLYPVLVEVIQLVQVKREDSDW